MKKLITGFLVLAAMLATPMVAQTPPPSASTEIYSWSAFDRQALLELFYNALQLGRKYPTQAEIDALGFDLEFARSHVRPAAIIVDQATQVKPAINPTRKLWLNTPVGVGKMIGGYPQSNWRDEAFTMWPYTALQGGWNHGWFQAPGAYVSAAHKHGTDMLSGVTFFDTGVSSSDFVTFITTKEGDDFKYAEPLINLLMFLGQDGINYNVEGNNQVNSVWQDFHARCYELAAEKGFHNFHVGYYNNYSSLSGQEGNLWKDGKRVSTALMLNYSANNFASTFANSVSIANSLSPEAVEGLYGSTWIVTLDRSWTRLTATPEINICLWGEHDQFRIYSYGKGMNDMIFQETYQERLERFISGGNRNPANTPAIRTSGIKIEETLDAYGRITEPAMTNFHGLASFVAERSAVKGDLPFATHFNIGNGPVYHYKGKKTFGQWYNLGAQDMQPTYRWLVMDATTAAVANNIQPKLSYRDAYMGGSMLVLEGTPSSNGTDVVLYRSELNVNGPVKATVAVKMVNKLTQKVEDAGKPTQLYVLIKAGDAWREYPVGATTVAGWEEKEIDLSDLAAGMKIQQIGFRVKGQADANYQVFVGKLALADGRSQGVPTPRDLAIEVREETTGKLGVKMAWKMPVPASASRADYGLVYNDEVNVHHFEIFYKNGESGVVKEIGRTSTWSHYTGQIYFDNPEARNDEPGYDKPYVGVRAVSVDLKTVSPIVWTKVPRQDYYDLQEESPERYCKSFLDPNSAGAEVARTQRYLKSVTTSGCITDLNYNANAPDADGDNYVNYTAQPIKVTAGQQFSINFLAASNGTVTASTPSTTDDGMRYTFGVAYADWNNNGVFELEGETSEVIFSLGTSRASTLAFQTTGVNQTFTVPANACPGTVRIRLVFSDAWFTHPGPCGPTSKGFSMDIGMEIVNDNPPTTCGTVQTFHDQGEAEAPYNWDSTDDVSSNEELNSALLSFYPNPATESIQVSDADEVKIYSVSGTLVASQSGRVSSMNIAHLPEGIYMVKMKKESAYRTLKLVKK